MRRNENGLCSSAARKPQEGLNSRAHARLPFAQWKPCSEVVRSTAIGDLFSRTPQRPVREEKQGNTTERWNKYYKGKWQLWGGMGAGAAAVAQRAEDERGLGKNDVADRPLPRGIPAMLLGTGSLMGDTGTRPLRP